MRTAHGSLGCRVHAGSEPVRVSAALAVLTLSLRPVQPRRACPAASSEWSGIAGSEGPGVGPGGAVGAHAAVGGERPCGRSSLGRGGARGRRPARLVVHGPARGLRGRGQDPSCSPWCSERRGWAAVGPPAYGATPERVGDYAAFMRELVMRYGPAGPLGGEPGAAPPPDAHLADLERAPSRTSSGTRWTAGETPGCASTPPC